MSALYGLDNESRADVVHAAMVFFKMNVMADDDAAIVRDYDGTLAGLTAAIESVVADPEIRALGVDYTIPDVLRSLEALHSTCFLQSVACIKVQQVGHQVVRLNNTTPVPRVADFNRRCACIEILDVSIRAKTALTLRDQLAAAARAAPGRWSMERLASTVSNNADLLAAVAVGVVLGLAW